MEITPIVNEDFLEFQDDMTLSKMLGKLKRFEKRSGLVFRNNKYLGLIEKKKLLRSRIDPSRTKISHLVQKTPLLSEHADIIETAYLMFQSNVDFLPVERNKQIIGVVTGLELAKLASRLPEVSHLKVSDVKYTKPRIVRKDDAVATAIEVMYKDRVEQIPVFVKGKLYGVISYRDLMRKYLNWSPKRDVSAKFNKVMGTRSAEVDIVHLSNLPVSSFSTNENLLTVQFNQSLKNAVQLMTKRKVSDLLVMQDNQFLGVLAVKNILRRVGSLKIPKNYNIKFIGLNKVDLQPHEKYNVKKIAANEAFKLQRAIHNEFTLTIHIKEYEKEGHQHKYSVNLRVEFPGQIVTSTQEDWVIETAVRKAFNNAKNYVKKKYKGDGSRRKE